ncbi:Transposase [compost metagenome]
MRTSKFTTEQIAFALKQAELGTSVAEVYRKMGITEQTYYRWKKKYGGLGASELRRMRQLEEENRDLTPEKLVTENFCFREFEPESKVGSGKSRKSGLRSR